MKKIRWFQMLIRENKKMLIREHGFSYSTLQRWVNAERNPSYENALRLAKIFKLPIKKFPYIKYIINE